MKNIIGYFVVIISVCSSITYAQTQTPFSDIGMHTYRHSIQTLWERNIVSGYGNHTFGPDNNITRAELLKIVLEASSASVGNQTGCFDDIKDEWFAKYVCYAHAKGIINGYADNTFKPNQYITISESFKIGLKGFGIYVSDATNKEGYAPYFDFVHDNNIISKYAVTHDMYMKRGMMAHLIYQLLLNKERKITFNNQRSVISSGCGQDAPTITPSFSYVNGIKRNYITVIGKNYDKNNPIPLVIAFHGRTNSNEMIRSYYGIEKAAEGNAIIVYPSGLPEEGPSRNRSNPGDKLNQLRDLALFDQLVEEFSQNYCINKDKIFVVGHSLGAWFTNSLACARGDIIRAIGSVGGSTTIGTCNGPVAAMIMHNPEDNLASYQSALTARNQLLKQNSCGSETREVGPVGSNCVQYTNCQTDAPVVWCPYSQSTDYRGNYYPHVRPSFAGQEIWNFFMAQ